MINDQNELHIWTMGHQLNKSVLDTKSCSSMTETLIYFLYWQNTKMQSKNSVDSKKGFFLDIHNEKNICIM